MSSLDLDFDMQRIHLEFEWRAEYEASIIARAEYRALAANSAANADALDGARERLDRAEALLTRIIWRLERSEAC